MTQAQFDDALAMLPLGYSGDFICLPEGSKIKVMRARVALQSGYACDDSDVKRYLCYLE